VLADQLEFAPERDAEVFAAAPAAPAVFALYGDGEPYVAKTANLRRRLQRLLAAPDSERTRSLNLRARVRRIEYTLTGSDFEAWLALYGALRAAFGADFRKRLRLRPAPLVKFILENPYPRAHPTTKISRLGSSNVYFGPFATRVAAEKFLNDSLDLFKLRRCDFDLNPDPAFPGCIYSEMKMCLAPCFKGCTDEEYAAEVGRVEQYLETGGQSLVREISATRDAASTALEFEQAAALHARLEKAKAAAGQRPEIARRLDQLNGLIVQRSAFPEHVALFRLVGGRIAPAVQFSVATGSTSTVGDATKLPQSMEARIAAALAAAPPLPDRASAAELMDQLALLRRWYFRGSRAGEIFLTDERGELPMRRVVRGVSRVYRGEREAPDLNESARDYWVNRGRAVERQEPD
jgi:excinuclease UvrABC nuclease subunit